MEKQKQHRKHRTGSRSYDLDELESQASAMGGPTRGFEEDAEYEHARSLGFTFEGDHTTFDGDGTTSDTDTIEFTPEEELLPGEFEEAVGPKGDLRYAGEDLSGVSEWSMRARNLQLEDGLDAGDFARSDEEILSEAEVALESSLPGNHIRVEVQGAEVTLLGDVDQQQARQDAEDVVLNIPGVREVHNRIEIQLGK